jgi:hypothetical protein
MTNSHTQSFSAATLVDSQGGRFSKELGIDLSFGDSREIFKWFLAAILFGARISETLAVRAYRDFIREGVTTPQQILARGWDGLVAILDHGGYVRYDFKTATKLLEVTGTLMKCYGGDLNALHQVADSPVDLEQRIQSLGKGIGEVTVNIFLREMRGIWNKAEPLPSELVLAAAKSCRFIPMDVADKRTAAHLLMSLWQREGKSPKDFPEFETALLRLGLQQRRRSSRKRKGSV